MFHVWIGKIDLTTLILILSVLVLFPLQLLLCFKVKSVVLRLLPSASLVIVMVAFIVKSYFAVGWDSLGYVFLAIFVGIMLLSCILAWIVWGVVKLVAHIRKKKISK